MLRRFKSRKVLFVAIVWCLSLWLTSCSSRKKEAYAGTFAINCAGGSGDYIISSEIQPSTIPDYVNIVFQVDGLTENYDVVQVVLATDGGSEYLVKIPYLTVTAGQIYKVSNIPLDEIDSYPLLVIWNPDSGSDTFADFVQREEGNDRFATCDIPASDELFAGDFE